jgi:hypothetical protein
MDEFIEEINEKLNTSFKVTNIPVKLLKEFKAFCKEECGNVYWVGIFQLMKLKKQNEEILTLFNSLKGEIEELRNKVQPKSNVRRTFGHE